MSQLTDIKQALHSIAQDAREGAAGLQGFSQRFSALSAQVQATIGNSAQGADRKVVQSLQSAEEKLKEATLALRQAHADAASFAASL